jgi:hypothetical protein
MVIIGGGDSGKDGQAEAATPRYCQTIDADFCADFDIPGDAGAGFQPPAVVAPGAFSFENMQVWTPPTAAEMDLASDGGGASASIATVLQPDAGSTGTLRLDMDLFLAAPPTNSTPPIFVFYFGVPGPSNTQFGLAIINKTYELANLTSSVAIPINPPPTTGAWTHAQLVIHASTTAGDATLTFAPNDAGVPTAMVGSVATIVTGGPPFFAGINIGGFDTFPAPQPALSFFYDDVVVHLE